MFAEQSGVCVTFRPLTRTYFYWRVHLRLCATFVFAGYPSEHKQRLFEYVQRIEEEGGVVAYKCGICYKTSARRDALTSHIENIHFPGAYKCHYCELVFNSQNTRNVHIGRKHKYNPSDSGLSNFAPNDLALMSYGNPPEESPLPI